MATVPSSANVRTPLNNKNPETMEICANKITATIEIRKIGKVVPAAITTNTVNTQVALSTSVPAHISDRPLQQQ